MINPRENEDKLTELRKALAELFDEEEDIEFAKNDDEEIISPLQRYEIRFSTSKPKRKFILTCRTSVRLEEMSDKTVKTILQEFIDKTFETPFKVREVFSVENL